MAEIPLALRQPHGITPPGESPLLGDADVALSLHFYFLKARVPLTSAQVQHLSSPERLVFGSGPLPTVAKKRPRQQPPTQLEELVSRLRRRAVAQGSPLPLLAIPEQQPGVRTRGPPIHKQPGIGTQVPCLRLPLTCLCCVSVLFCTNSQGRDPSTRRGKGPTAAILTLPLGLFFLCSGVPWRCDVSGKSGFAVVLRSPLPDGQIRSDALLKCSGSTDCAARGWAAPPPGGYAQAMPRQWHAVSTARMCSRRLVCWMCLALQPFNVGAHCPTGEKVCMLVWQVRIGPHMCLVLNLF